MIKIITEQQLNKLRVDIRSQMGERRYNHTLGVEREINKLARLYCPDKSEMLRAAALLHDITKEYTADMHIAIMKEHGLDVSDISLQSPKLFHSLTASLLIPEKYSEFAIDELIRAVSVHTTGCGNMTLSDKLLYLADYIEDTRTFDDCIKLRCFFWDGIERGEDKHKHLDRTLLMSIDITINDLLERGKIIADSTLAARNSLILKVDNLKE